MPAAAKLVGGRKRGGLLTKEKKPITREMARRYRKADRKGKQRILNNFVHVNEYNRKYTLHVLANRVKEPFTSCGSRLTTGAASAWRSSSG